MPLFTEQLGHVTAAALALWGAEAQTLMMFEEMAELQKELCKNARGKDNRAEIAEEIADVRIMLDQMEIAPRLQRTVAAVQGGEALEIAGAHSRGAEGGKIGDHHEKVLYLLPLRADIDQ